MMKVTLTAPPARRHRLPEPILAIFFVLAAAGCVSDTQPLLSSGVTPAGSLSATNYCDRRILCQPEEADRAVERFLRQNPEADMSAYEYCIMEFGRELETASSHGCVSEFNRQYGCLNQYQCEDTFYYAQSMCESRTTTLDACLGLAPPSTVPGSTPPHSGMDAGPPPSTGTPDASPTPSPPPATSPEPAHPPEPCRIDATTGLPALPAACLPRCSGASLVTLRGCSDRECQVRVLRADRTASIMLTVVEGTASEDIEVGCEQCFNLMNNSCVSRTCPREWNALIACDEGGCDAEAMALDSCMADRIAAYRACQGERVPLCFGD